MIKDKGQGKYYIYRHIRLDKNEPFYIGVGTKTVKVHKNAKNETYKEIYRRAYQRANRNEIWKKIVNKTKYIVEIIYESDNYNFIEQKEIEFIKLYGRKNLKTGILVNLTDGGKGKNNTIRKPHSDETKLKMSMSSKGKIKSEEHKQNMSLAKLANPLQFWKGKTLSEEHKHKMRKPKNRTIINNINKGKPNLKVRDNHQKHFKVIKDDKEFYYFMNHKQLSKELGIISMTMFRRILSGIKSKKYNVEIYEQIC